MSPPAAAPSRGRLLPPRAAPPQSSSPQQSAGKFPQGPPPPRFVLPSGRGFPAQAPVRAAVSAASRVLHAGDRTGAASPPISTGAVIRPSDPTRPAAAPAHRVGLAPPRPGHSPFSRDAQATAARGEYTATIGDAQAMAPIDDDTTDVNMQTDWSLGDEEEFQRQNNLGVPVADSFNSQDRSQSSLMHRWSVIQEAVNEFCGCISRIENRNQSGVTIEDKLSDARKLYKVEDKQKRSFMYMHCYNFLKNQPKWIERRIQLAAPKTSNKKQKINATSSPALSTPACNEGNNGDESEAADPDAATNAMVRPLGRKKEKEKLRQQSNRPYIESLDYLWAKKKETDVEKEMKKDERYKHAFALEEKRIAMEKEKFEFKRMVEEERIMRIDTSDMDLSQQEYYKILKDRILTRCMYAGDA